MKKLIESTYLSLDGKISGEGFWAAQMEYRDTYDEHAAKLLEPAEALVLGRATFEVFAATWPGQTGEIADKFNAMPKYVASRTLTDAGWNAEILRGDAVKEVAELKESGDGTLLKYGTGPLSQALLEGGQLDELHLWLFPFIVGSGEDLLPGIMTTHLDLADVTELDKGCVVLTYKPKK
jgi:dihydrofolate reductase